MQPLVAGGQAVQPLTVQACPSVILPTQFPLLLQTFEPEQAMPIVSSLQVAAVQPPLEQYLQAPVQVFEPTVSSVLFRAEQLKAVPEPEQS